jgi:hypothetical protein
MLELVNSWPLLLAAVYCIVFYCIVMSAMSMDRYVGCGGRKEQARRLLYIGDAGNVLLDVMEKTTTGSVHYYRRSHTVGWVRTDDVDY